MSGGTVEAFFKRGAEDPERNVTGRPSQSTGKRPFRLTATPLPCHYEILPSQSLLSVEK